MWQSSQAFLVANTIIIAFISQSIFKTDGQIEFKPNWGIFTLSIIGVAISFLWLGTYIRRSKYYEFRMSQARQREPDSWNLVDGDGRDFAEGGYVVIDGKRYDLGFGKMFKTRIVIIFFILLFILLYVIVSFITLPRN